MSASQTTVLKNIGNIALGLCALGVLIPATAWAVLSMIATGLAVMGDLRTVSVFDRELSKHVAYLPGAVLWLLLAWVIGFTMANSKRRA